MFRKTERSFIFSLGFDSSPYKFWVESSLCYNDSTWVCTLRKTVKTAHHRKISTNSTYLQSSTKEIPAMTDEKFDLLAIV